MRLQADTALRDPEVLDLVGDDPELLAIVDALHCTQRATSRRSLPLRPLLALCGVVAAVVAVVLAAPWQSGEGLAARALAAVGQQPVVHVVSARRLPGLSTLELRTGRVTPASSRVELYFDPGRKLERTVSSSPLGASDELHTATGDWIDGEPVWTCARIAAHPAAAARARVSCPAGASTRPQPPTLDPALAEFARGYQAALASGNVRQLRDGRVNGRPVHWLAIGTGERVAVDAHTLLPVLVSHTDNGKTSTYRVLEFETVPYTAGDFARAKAPTNPPAAGESVHGSREVTLAEARRALGGTLLLPRHIPGLRFESARIVNLVTGFDHKRPYRHSIAVQLRYRSDHGQLTLHESRYPDMIAGFAEAAPIAGTALVRYSASLAQLSQVERERLADAVIAMAPWLSLSHTDGLYLSVEAWSKPQLLQVATSLEATRR